MFYWSQVIKIHIFFIFKALGNHEFDNGVEGLIRPFLQNINCSVVSANIHPDQTLAANFSGYYKPYTIINVGSEKVVVIGYTTAETPFLSMPGKRINFCVFDEVFDVFIGTLLQAAVLLYSELYLLLSCFHS